MRDRDEKPIMTGSPDERCDIKVWSGQCQSESRENKYLCNICGTINCLDHEMRHDGFPYVSGDTDNLS